MNNFTLTKTRLFEGVWEGVLRAGSEGSNGPPAIEVTHLEKPLGGVQITENHEEGHWVIRVPIPIEVICDGVQVFLINDVVSGETLNSFTLLAGEVLGDDYRAEMELLREELDMLKRAFRRHCLETV